MVACEDINVKGVIYDLQVRTAKTNHDGTYMLRRIGSHLQKIVIGKYWFKFMGSDSKTTVTLLDKRFNL